MTLRLSVVYRMAEESFENSTHSDEHRRIFRRPENLLTWGRKIFVFIQKSISSTHLKDCLPSVLTFIRDSLSSGQVF